MSCSPGGVHGPQERLAEPRAGAPEPPGGLREAHGLGDPEDQLDALAGDDHHGRGTRYVIDLYVNIYCIILYYIVLYTILCFILYYIMLCYFMLCYVMLCYVILLNRYDLYRYMVLYVIHVACEQAYDVYE